MKAQEVIIGNDDGCGRVTLNRPKAINALNFDMCRTIIAALQSWEFDPEIAAIIIDHSAGRGFCAGGDLRALYENIRSGGGEVLDFFRTEYRLDHLLFTLAKPSVCFMDGHAGDRHWIFPGRWRRLVPVAPARPHRTMAGADGRQVGRCRLSQAWLGDALSAAR
jgi:1,4-dihydroxy-2-naphthoyl-CoA synthase